MSTESSMAFQPGQQATPNVPGPAAASVLPPPPPPPELSRRPRRLTALELSTMKARRSVPIAMGLTAAAGCAYVLLNDPNASSAYPQCPFKSMTGLDCPGCGLTRGMFALMQGRPLDALNHNLLLVLLVPVVVYTFAMYAARGLGWELPPMRIPRWAGTAIIVFILAFSVVRNLPGPLRFLDAVA